MKHRVADHLDLAEADECNSVATMGKVKDPTRIPTVLEAVRAVWEGQPDLSFGAIVGMLENHGMSWASTDEEILVIAERIVRQHPPKLSEDLLSERAYCVITTNPECRYTVDAKSIVVDRGENYPLSTWKFKEITQSAVGGPLKIVDTNGVQQRMGIVTLITALQNPSSRQLVTCISDDDSYSHVDVNFPFATVVSKERRELSTHTYRLKKKPVAEVGVHLVLELANDESGSVHECGLVKDISAVG